MVQFDNWCVSLGIAQMLALMSFNSAVAFLNEIIVGRMFTYMY